MLEESALFWDVVLPRINIARGTPAFVKLLREYLAQLSQKHRDASDESNKEIWAKLLEHAEKMLGH